MRLRHLSILFAILPLLSGPTRAQPARTWQPVGLSGGGAMFSPAISPADPSRMMVNCDMSAAYITQDGGATWQMISWSQLHANTRCNPAFDPRDPQTVFAADGGSRLKVSHDGGVHFEPLAEFKGELEGRIAIDPTYSKRMLVGTSQGIFSSADAGKTWTACEGLAGDPLSFHFDLNTPALRRTCFAGTSKGIWRSRDSGETWTKVTNGLPARDILSFAGGSDPKQRLTILYCSVPSSVEGGSLTGGIYRSTDGGASWQSAMGEGLNKETKAFDEWAIGPVAQYRHVLTSDADPRLVYTFNTNTGIPPPHNATVFRSTDAGATWTATFQGDPRYPNCNVERDYTVCEDGQFYQDVPWPAIDDRDPDRLILVTMGQCYLTVDGGKTWKCGHTHLVVDKRMPGPSSRWECNGLVVTTTWNYYVDPFEPDRHYICYTDIGFARSQDAGRTWQWWSVKGRAPWSNTCYELAFDPDTPGKVWGAFSNVHDIPNGNIIWGNHRDTYPGGVCVSYNSTQTWAVSNQGLPAAAVTSVVVDPKSPKGSRMLYAAVFNHGVYRSTDDGNTWSARSNGLGAPSNMRVCRVYLHPDGTLFALVTAMRRNGQFQPEGVGLYRSRDRGDHWELVNRSNPLLWPKDFTVDRRDSKTIYVGACDAQHDQAGLYRTTDGGATWTRLARKGSEHFGAYPHPQRPGWIYMTLTEGAPGAGLWLSKDNGATWTPLDGLPFSNAQRVTVDPHDPDTIYVTTFGGSVWRGPAGG